MSSQRRHHGQRRGAGADRDRAVRHLQPAGRTRTKAIVGQIPVGRIGRPEEVATAIAFFLGEDAGFVTGQVLYVCGGLSVGKVGL